MDASILSEFIGFFHEAINGLRSGFVFFGGPLDLVRYIFDILLVTVFSYSLLRILRETRAWQLLKGIVLLLLVSFVCMLLQMEMITFIFTNIMSLVAIAVVVIFQPELRKALESVGLKSFSSSAISNAIAPGEDMPEIYTVRLIDQVVDACQKMAKTYTGALIIFERTAKLGDLVEQENAVELDSSVTSTMLQSIFYKGSPLHDGALLIQNGRISAARCHIPLSENAHLRDGLGTRHRAALGASEIGDAVSLAVSEERGEISLAIDGCLYPMKNAEDLRKNLMVLFGVSDVKHTLGQRIKARYNRRRKDSGEMEGAEKSEHESVAVPSDAVVCSTTPKENAVNRRNSQTDASIPVAVKAEKKSNRFSLLQKVFLMVLSFLFSCTLWVYIQVSTNPVVQDKSLIVPLTFKNTQVLEENGLGASYPYTSVELRISGRKNDLDTITSADFVAYVDFAGTDEAGVQTFTIHISSKTSFYYNIRNINPENFVINIYIEGE